MVVPGAPAVTCVPVREGSILRDWTPMRKRSRRTPKVLALAAALAIGTVSPAAAALATRPPAVHVVSAVRHAVVLAAAVTAQASAPTTSVVTEVDDPASTRTVNRIIAALLVLGVVLLGVTVWFWVATRPLHPSLEGLDLMSSRRWSHADSGKQQRMLDKVHNGRGIVDERVVPSGAVGGAVNAPVPAGRVRGDHTPPP